MSPSLMYNALAFWRRCWTLARQDFVLLAKIRLLFGLLVGLSACLLRFFARGHSMTHVEDLLIDIAILVGSLAIVSLGAFFIKLLQAPAKLYFAKKQDLLNAERVIGPPESVTREAVMVCANIRDFVGDFNAKHGSLSKLLAFTDPQKIDGDTKRADWGYKFTDSFRADLGPQVEAVLHHLRAEGLHDIRANSLLKQAPFYPDFALELAAIIFKMALSLTINQNSKEV